MKGSTLPQIREALGLSTKEMAQALDTVDKMVCALENMGSIPRVTALGLQANILPMVQNQMHLNINGMADILQINRCTYEKWLYGTQEMPAVAWTAILLLLLLEKNK